MSQNNNNNNYVRMDLFMETIRRIEATNEAFKAEIKAQNLEFRENVTRDLSDMRGEISGMHGEIKAMNAKLNAMFAVIGLFGALFTIISALQYFK